MHGISTEVKYVGEDDWGRKLYRTEHGNTLVDVDGMLYTRTPDYDEPCSPTGIKTPTE